MVQFRTTKQLPLSAFLIIRDLSRLSRCSSRCSFSDRLLVRVLTCGQSSVIAVMYSSLGLLDLGCLAVGRRLLFLKKCAILRRLTTEYKSSRKLDMSGASGLGAGPRPLESR